MTPLYHTKEWDELKCTCIGWRYICPKCQERAGAWERSLAEHEREYCSDVAEAIKDLREREREVAERENERSVDYRMG